MLNLCTGAVRCVLCIEKLQEYAPRYLPYPLLTPFLAKFARLLAIESRSPTKRGAPLRVSVQNTPLPLPGTLSCSRSIRIRVVLLGHLSIENDQRVAHAAFHPADAVQESGRMHNGLALLTVNDLDAPVEEPKQLAALVVCI